DSLRRFRLQRSDSVSSAGRNGGRPLPTDIGLGPGLPRLGCAIRVNGIDYVTGGGEQTHQRPTIAEGEMGDSRRNRQIRTRSNHEAVQNKLVAKIRTGF